MASQGWKPGDFLGAENANHSGHYTAANASHIRVMLRDDNLGLGAQKGKSNAETFGLSTLSGIFGRLNGKSDVEVQKQQDTQRDWQLRSYQAQNYGFMNFVSGGLLVGDKMELPEQKKVIETVDALPKSERAAEKTSSKKRKVEDDDAELSTKAKKRKSKGDAADSSVSVEDAEEAATSKKSKKDKKKRQLEEASADSNAEAATAKSSKKDKKRKKSDNDDAPLDDEKRVKLEKRARKEERRRRKEEKRAKKAAKVASREQSSDSSSAEEVEEDVKAVVPKAAQPAQPMFAGSRHAVRQRYIQQKRMASTNAQAMAEILMLKAGA